MQVPQISQNIRTNFPGTLPTQGHPPMMMGMRPGVTSMINPYTILPEQEQKKRQFAKSVYVSGFQKTVTTAMLERHFANVKPVHGIKLPFSKFNQNKGFAFIYFGSEDDANLAKKQLDRSAILREKIRVTKTVVAQNLSKMIFKLKVRGMNDNQIADIEKEYFNDENLQKQVENIIQPIFGKAVQINKIVVPVSKTQKKPLTYARVFFYISNLKEAVSIVRRDTGVQQQAEQQKNQYEIVLGYIVELLNKQEKFSKHATAQIYEYTKKNQSNVLHLKGINYKKGESLTALADELKDFIQQQNMQWQIVNSYVAFVQGKGAWANVTFGTYEDTKNAYQHLKNLRPIFRQNALYGSLRNVKDLRTVVFSVVKQDVQQKTVRKFLEDLAESSPIVPSELNQTPVRKYQFFSFNIIEQKSFFLDNQGVQIGKQQQDSIPESWRFNNTVPRRLVVHFFTDIEDQDMRTLLNDIRTNPKHTQIFMIDEKKNPLRANHQRGHIKNNSYVKHTELNRERKKRIVQRNDNNNRQRPPRQDQGQGQMRQKREHNNYQQNNMSNAPTAPKLDFNMFSGKPGALGGMPKFTPGMNHGMKPNYGNMAPMASKVPPIGMNQAPIMGGKPIIPMMGQGQQPPMMGQIPMGQIPMGQPPMMGNPMMGKVPQMGNIPPQMGNMPPQMGQKPMQPNIQPKQP